MSFIPRLPRPGVVFRTRPKEWWDSHSFWMRGVAPSRFWTHLGFENRFVQLWLRFCAARSGCYLRCGPYAWDLIKGAQTIRISRRQFASVTQLAADFDGLFEALVPNKVGPQMLLDFSRIQVHTYREIDMKFELAQWPESDAPIEAYFEIYRPTSKELAFDIGAKYGVSSYLLSRFVGKVIAFEPDPSLHELLERNVGRHALAQVTVAPVSVSSLAELIRLYGGPSFCRVNLDYILPKFLLHGAEAWTSLPISFAARSNSEAVRAGFISLLRDAGFEILEHRGLGLIWARPQEIRDE